MDISAQLSVNRTVFTVRDFVSWYRKNELNLRPPFQRLNVWKPKAKSYLIDTIVRGLPIPIIILRDKSGITLDVKREVVDGQQRLTTLIAFVTPEQFPVNSRITLSRVHFGDLANKPFADLPPSVQEAILNYEISTHILPSSVDDQQVLRIFSRLNATGTPLNKQELRNATYYGNFKVFVFELSLQHLNHWRNWSMFTNDAFARMKEVEYTSELVMQLQNGVSATSQPRLDNIYAKYDDTFPSQDVVKERFDYIFDQIENGFGHRMANSEFCKQGWFYTLFGLIHDRVYGTQRYEVEPVLRKVAPHTLPNTFWKKLEEVDNLIRKPTGLSASTVKLLSARTTNLNTRKDRAEFLAGQL
jgi:hypothetical protein